MPKDLEKAFLNKLAQEGRITEAQGVGIYEEIKAARRNGERIAAAALAVERGLVDVKKAQEALSEQGREIAVCPECNAKWLISLSGGERRLCQDCEAELLTYKGDDLEGLRIVFVAEQERAVEDPLIGQILQNCRIEEKIGQGGRGVVYRGMDLGLKRKVAIKFLLEHLAERNKSYVMRFVREARSAAKLEHRNIVSIYAVGKELGKYYIIMQYIEGGSLSGKLARLGRLWMDEAVKIVEQVAEGLAYAHHRGIIHLDAKPDNIMIDRDNVARIADFGLAREVTAEGQQLPGKLQGTPRYMSPEQCRGEEPDGRSDMYSLGTTLIRLLTGRTPYNGQIAEVLRKHASPDPVPGLSRSGEFSDDLRAVAAKMTAKPREERYQGMDEVVEDLKRIQRDEQTAALAQLMAKRPARKGFQAVELEPEPELDELVQMEEERWRPRASALARVLLTMGILAMIAIGVVVLRRAGRDNGGPGAGGGAQALYEDALRYADANPGDFEEIIERFQAVLEAGAPEELAVEVRRSIGRIEERLARLGDALGALERSRDARELARLREAYEEARSLSGAVGAHRALAARREETEGALRARIEERATEIFREGVRLEKGGQETRAIELYDEVAREGLPDQEITSLAKTELRRLTIALRAAEFTKPFVDLKEAVAAKRWHRGRAILAELGEARERIVGALSAAERRELSECERLIASHKGQITVAKGDLGDFPSVAEAVSAASRDRSGEFTLVFPEGGSFAVRSVIETSASNIREIRGEGGEKTILELASARGDAPGGLRVDGRRLAIRNVALVSGRLSLGSPVETAILVSAGGLELEGCVIRGFKQAVHARPGSAEGAMVRATNCAFDGVGTAFRLESRAGGDAEWKVNLEHCVLSAGGARNARGFLISFAGGLLPQRENRWSIAIRDTIFDGLKVVHEERYTGRSAFVEGINTKWSADYNCFYGNESLYILSLENAPTAPQLNLRRLSLWRGRCRQERWSIAAEPEFLDRKSFCLAPGSRCRGAGSQGGDIGLQEK